MSKPVRLPEPVTTMWEWQMHGLCRGMDSAVFFHPEGERGHKRAAREEQAKRVCAQCPVLQRCREYAVTAGEPYGVWGGMSAPERMVAETMTERMLAESIQDNRAIG